MPHAELTPYDAILLYSFGGPNKPEDVVPFLRNVTAGKGIPDERLEEVGEHYYGFGGKSPINEQNLALKQALEDEMARRGLSLPVVWGNRNWEPYTSDALDALQELGARRALMLVTSAYGSYSGCRQYREDMAFVQLQRGDLHEDGTYAPNATRFDKVRPYFNTPGFMRSNLEAIREALNALTPSEPQADSSAPHIAFVTHSIPQTMEDASGKHHPGTYSEQHEALARAIMEELNQENGSQLDYSLSYCSRSGPPHQPWLEPDINDHLRNLVEKGVNSVVIAPIGFISDHMEVIYDLDTEALATCEELGLTALRARTVGTDPVFVQSLVDLLEERAALARNEPVEEQATTAFPALHSVCPAHCCLQRDGQPSTIPTVCGL